MSKVVPMWGPFIRVLHWYLVLAFTLNYFVLDAGSDPHQILGYIALVGVCTRILWGVFSNEQGSFKTIALNINSLTLHLRHLRNRRIPIDAGHNPMGWLMIISTWFLFIGLGVTGFMLEEVDYFFGNSLIEGVHSIFSNILYALVLMHIFAVLFVSWWGNISLVRPMLTGKRKMK